MPTALLSRPPAVQHPGPRPEVDGPGASSRAWHVLGLLASLVLTALAALTSKGTGWEWGDPLTELRWYTSGLDSPSTLVQLVGNLALIALPAAFAVRLWPALRPLPRLVGASLAAGAAIEVLQFLLPIGRVVSPLDALLNAVGAIVAALLVLRVSPATGSRTAPRNS